MKKYLLSCLLLGASTFLQAATPPDTLALQHKQSVWRMALLGGGSMECNVRAEWPALQGDGLAEVFTDWLDKSLQPIGLGGKPSGNALLNGWESLFLLEGTQAQHEAMEKAGKGNVKPFSLALDVDLRCMCNKPMLSTFRLNAIHYNARGERTEVVREKSFHLPRGEGIGWDEIVNPKRRARFNKVVAEALQSYFGVTDWDNLRLKLNDGDGLSLATFPLPQGGPALEKQGLRLCYDPGEIAPVSMGRPVAFIPYSSISSHLTSYGKKLIK